MKITEVEKEPGTPCERMWQRLNKVYGEERSVAAALALSRRNEQTRKIPLVGNGI